MSDEILAIRACRLAAESLLIGDAAGPLTLEMGRVGLLTLVPSHWSLLVVGDGECRVVGCCEIDPRLGDREYMHEGAIRCGEMDPRFGDRDFDFEPIPALSARLFTAPIAVSYSLRASGLSLQ